MSEPEKTEAASTAGLDFVRTIVAEDNAKGTYGGRVTTRFPPEPNGFLHIGHATSICLNFGIARENGGTCNLRFDDTNPTTEDPRYVAAIEEDVRWMGFEWDGEYYASDYFDQLYGWAEQLVKNGKAYVDSSSEEEIRALRGTVTEPGTDSPHRNRSPQENLDLLRRMRAGEFEDGAHVLRAKIDMAHPNMKMRDPLLYRIRHAHHYRTGDAWCIYPMYDFAHPLSDAIENITHSLCTLEFENNRAIYDWLIDNVDVGEARPRQYEFARLNLDYTVMSKRKLLRLVKEGHVEGWDDPRMPTISGLRRRGIRSEAIRRFADLVGIAKANSRVDIGKLEYAVREDLNPEVRRVMCVIDPLKVVIANYPERTAGDTPSAGDGAGAVGDVVGEDTFEELDAPYYPHDVPKEGSRKVPFGRELYIERDDFREDPPQGYFRLAPGREVRLRYGYFITCNEVVKDDAGKIVELRCTYDPETRGGAAPDGRKVKGTIHWVSASRSVPVEVRLYDRLFRVADPDAEAAASGKDFTGFLNADSRVIAGAARIEPAAVDVEPGSRFQFERQGYFFVDPVDSRPGAPIFNRIVTLRDTWAKIAAQEAPEVGEKDVADGEAPQSGPGGAERRRRTKRSGADVRDEIRAASPELAARYDRYQSEFGLGEEDADVLSGDASVALLFEGALTEHDRPQELANWIVNDLAPYFDDGRATDLPFGGAELGALVALVDDGTISRPAGKEVLAIMADEGGDPAVIVEARGLQQVTDADAIESVVDEVIAAHPDKVNEYHGGRTGLAGFFVGQVMRETGGTADPQLVNDLVRAKLDG